MHVITKIVYSNHNLLTYKQMTNLLELIQTKIDKGQTLTKEEKKVWLEQAECEKADLAVDDWVLDRYNRY